MQVLACKHDCVRELATRSGRISPIENFLPLHYDYLQFAYYRGKVLVLAALLSSLHFVQVLPYGNKAVSPSAHTTVMQRQGLKEKQRTLEMVSSKVRLTEIQLSSFMRVF